MKLKLFYSAAEVSDILGITKNTLFNWEKAGKIPRPRRDPMNNYRIFSEKDLKKLRSITAR